MITNGNNLNNLGPPHANVANANLDSGIGVNVANHHTGNNAHNVTANGLDPRLRATTNSIG